jgi:4-aminobutyrate aminotransferase
MLQRWLSNPWPERFHGDAFTQHLPSSRRLSAMTSSTVSEPNSNLSNVWLKVTDLQVVRGLGCRVYDANDNAYLDFTAGIAAASTGHCHPKVVQAIADQAQRFVHAQANIYTHDLLEPVAARLAELTPDSIDTFFFSNSSDEILEAAVKLAKHATGRRNIITFDVDVAGNRSRGVRTFPERRVCRTVPRPARVRPGS